MDKESTETPLSPLQGWRLELSWLTGLLILAAVMLVVSRRTEIEHFAELARSAQPLWLVGGLALQVMTYLCAAAVSYSALQRSELRPSFWSIVPLGLAKLFTDQAIPTGGISGTLLLLRGLVRRGVPNGIAMAALLINLVSFYAAYIMAVAIALFLLYLQNVLDPMILAAAGIFLFIAAGIPALVLTLWHWSRLRTPPGLLGKLTALVARFPGLSNLISAMAAAPTELLSDFRPFIKATLLQFGIFVLDAATLWIMLQSLGLDVWPTVAYTALTIATLATTVGPVPLGLGTFEAVSVAMLHGQGISLAAALTATLLLRGFTFWLPMIPGMILARKELDSKTHAPRDL
jgi:uncharacterized protein (TIRG00374 family)